MDIAKARIYARTGSIRKITAKQLLGKWVLNIECSLAAADESGLLEKARGETKFFKSLDSVYQSGKQIAPEMTVDFG